MEDNIFTLKYDLQQCIANNIKKLETDYTLLFYEKDFMNLTMALECFENIKFSPNGSKMKFEGEIANDLKFTEEELLKVKQIAWKQSMAELMHQANESQKSEEQKIAEQLALHEQLSELLEAKQNEYHQFREPQFKEKRNLKNIKKELAKINVNLEYTEENELLLLAGNFQELELTKKQIRRIMDFSKKLDVFIIAPIYNDEDEEDDSCVGIRFAFGIDLTI